METSLVASPENTEYIAERDPDIVAQRATRVANILAEIIEKQKLYVTIQGKKYVKVDAWIGLGNLMGVYPKEVYVNELPDGGFESCVEIVSMGTGQVVGRASAICGVDEHRWGKAEKYARRSMSVTRATGKAFRLTFSWVMCLAGFEATPSEEMPREEERKVNAQPTTYDSREEMVGEYGAPPEGRKSVSKGRRVDTLYSGSSDQQQHLEKYLTDKGIPKDSWLAIHEKMIGQPKADITKILGEM